MCFTFLMKLLGLGRLSIAVELWRTIDYECGTMSILCNLLAKGHTH